MLEFLLRFKEAVRFLKHFFGIFWLTRGILFFLLVLLIGGGVLFALFEKIALSQGIYFAFITGLTIGFGDITPTTGLGQLISVCLGIIGMVFMGLVVAIATHSLRLVMQSKS